MFDPQAHFSVPLNDLGSRNSRFAGILVPQAKDADQAAGVTSVFLENAGDYHEAYTQHAYFGTLIRAAVSRLSGADKATRILDIGSGSGNSVIPLLEQFPQARIVASDISPPLLAILRDYTAKHGGGERLALVCMDAGKDFYIPDTFDLVVGAAILHHLVDPASLLKAVLRALKPGGFAIFFEPFEDGNAIIRLAFRQILKHPQARTLDVRVKNFLTGMSDYLSIPMDRARTDPVFETIDDKWLFSRSYFYDLAEKLGVSKTIVYPLHDTQRCFAAQTQTLLRLGAKLTPEALPPWAWDVLADFDTLLSPRVKEGLPIEGCVIFCK